MSLGGRCLYINSLSYCEPRREIDWLPFELLNLINGRAWPPEALATLPNCKGILVRDRQQGVFLFRSKAAGRESREGARPFQKKYAAVLPTVRRFEMWRVPSDLNWKCVSWSGRSTPLLRTQTGRRRDHQTQDQTLSCHALNPDSSYLLRPNSFQNEITPVHLVSEPSQ